ncbi:MAG: Methyltransferase type 12 [Bacteroidetes bacterium]|nr:Methyltransferase type 12 [Bacteroidota bacterium]
MNQTPYQDLLEQEARHWGDVKPDPQNPQIWDHAVLQEIFFGAQRRHLIDRVVANGPAILELGSGEGHLALDLARRKLRVTAIDLSSERINRARSKAAKTKLKVRFQVGDLNTMRLAKNRYDCVVANGSLHHILNLDHLLDEARKSLKPKGSLVVFDFIGMGAFRKTVAAILYALLPTYKPYSDKWRLRSRLKPFLASEQIRRTGLERNNASVLHPDSPFEEISQESIIPAIKKHFRIKELSTTLPFWYYLAAKIRLSNRLKYRVAKSFRAMDDFLVQAGIFQGAYVFIEASQN